MYVCKHTHTHTHTHTSIYIRIYKYIYIYTYIYIYKYICIHSIHTEMSQKRVRLLLLMCSLTLIGGDICIHSIHTIYRSSVEGNSRIILVSKET